MNMFPRLGLGLGLRTPHFSRAASGDCAGVDWFEVITENALVAGGNPRRVLRAAREHRPLALHGVSLSIASTDPLDEVYLSRVRALCDELEPAMVSDHLCWTSLGGHQTHDLLPVPYTREALDHVVARVAHVQDKLGRRILLENPSTYAVFAGDELTEPAFLAELATRADCGILLDINNVYVSSKNHGWNAVDYLAAIPAQRVGYFHLAGHTHDGALLIDTHDQPVCDDVWALHAAALARFPGASTLLERDDNVPDFDTLVAELQRASAA
ncbi:MAG: DUF692 domain-containing protein [Deltaproteobacteria bacterium]|nr:DUF692 domain-containing protein [Deltaproteobacteria bacterium]